MVKLMVFVKVLDFVPAWIVLLMVVPMVVALLVIMVVESVGNNCD